MNRLDRLIAELCPDGIPNRLLGDVCKVQNGFAFKSNLFRDEGKPILRISNIQSDKIDENNIVFFDKRDYRENLSPYIVRRGDIVVAMSGATTGKIGVNVSDDIYYLNQRVGKFEPYADELNNRYLYHILSSRVQEMYIMAGGGAQPNLSSEQLKKLSFPLPPLEVQREIVRILDGFIKLTAELVAELTAELIARKRQYAYYRDKVLTFGDDVSVVPLGEIAEIVRGSGLTKKDLLDEGVGCIHYGQIYTRYSTFTNETISFVSNSSASRLKKVQCGDLIMAVTSENYDDVCKTVAWLGEDIIVTGGHTAIIKHNQNPKYLAYFFQTNNFSQQKRKIAHGTKVIEVTPSKLNDILIPLPTLGEQARIVEILERFDALTTDISNGLSAEISARKKQYEYYRDKLLTFEGVCI